ncbi:hypothetical protein [Pseudonocardia alaniniphila]|uniref:Uncharacterized protein n=1 Tax=Pseudonocardia alaniniphila TaxID=75291 RepID=A0ABS9TD41_9PSEU|nr:hypothetical protein [Pseudonocardia alaniniphila]MCH6166443.1 hypothetical protein [Pseudonocardia alaniniphila]
MRTGDAGKPPKSAVHAETATTERAAGAEGRFAGRRSATVNLPFVTAQFLVPDLQLPSRAELGWVVHTARSMLPPGRSLLFFGGLAATAIVGIIEWPVAAAIGVGSALGGQGATTPQRRTGTAGTNGPGGTGG